MIFIYPPSDEAVGEVFSIADRRHFSYIVNEAINY